jgi:hypothetical protein
MRKQIFVIRRASVISAEAHVVRDRAYQPIECSSNVGHRRAWRLPGPVVIDPLESDEAQCLWTPLGDCLLDSSVVGELESAGLSGFETGVVSASRSSGYQRQYVQFSASGWGGIASKDSGVELAYKCDTCGHLKYSAMVSPGDLFDASQWDGSDFFLIWPLPKFIFLTPEAAEKLRRLHVTGLEVVPLEALKLWQGGFSPGRLHHWLGSSRASVIGASFGID